MPSHTPAPWPVGEFDETGGYDCMTAGIKVGPALLDGNEYGQAPCRDIDVEARARMEADAALIGEAHKLADIARRLTLATNEGDDLSLGTHYIDRQGRIRCKGSFLRLIEEARAAIKIIDGEA